MRARYWIRVAYVKRCVLGKSGTLVLTPDFAHTRKFSPTGGEDSHEEPFKKIF